MRVSKLLARTRDDERGATAVIVVLTLIALCGVIVLTVDVGQLLFKRRAMVNASDAAALSAAQTCAGLKDSDSPEAMADIFAIDNVTTVNSGAANIIDVVGCDGPPFGHVTVQYEMQQGLFFAGVLGFDGPAAVRTQATAGWGPAGGANPLPIVVYTGGDQGNCDIEEGIGPGISCYLWYDNDKFQGSSFGFLNLCTAADAVKGFCQSNKVGWDVGGATQCPDAKQYGDTWIDGTWPGGPNDVHYPDVTYVCRLSGYSSNLWANNLDDRVGDDLIFPVNDCSKQVNSSGVPTGCTPTGPPDKYDIIGFITLHLDAVLDSAAEWGGRAQTSCQASNVNVTPGMVVPLSSFNGGQCPSGSTPSGVLNFKINNQTSSPNWTYDNLNKWFTWTGPAARVDVNFDWWLNGECGQPPGNSSAVCIKTHTVEVRFGGSFPGGGANFGLRAVRLCDLPIGSCPEQQT